MKSFLVHLRALVQAAVGRDVGFNTDDRFDPGFFCLLIKFHGSIKVAVVRERDCIHPEFFRAGDDLIYFCQSV